MLCLLILSAKGGYKLHSAHTDQATAEKWKACKEHDNESCEIVAVDRAAAEDLSEVLDKLFPK